MLEYCVKAETLTRENYYINYLKPYYNIAKDSKAPMLGRKHTIETLKKMSIASKWRTLSEASKLKGVLKRTGISLSPETRAKMSLGKMAEKQ